MEPYLEEYRPYDAKKNWNDLLKTDSKMAVYYDYLSVRYLFRHFTIGLINFEFLIASETRDPCNHFLFYARTLTRI